MNDSTPIGSDPPEAWISEEHMVRHMRRVQEENRVLRALLWEPIRGMSGVCDTETEFMDLMMGWAERARAALGRKG